VLVAVGVLAVVAAGCTAADSAQEAPSVAAEPSPAASASPSAAAPAASAADAQGPSQQELVSCIAGEEGILGRLGSNPLPPASDVAAQVGIITDRVEQLRELQAKEEVTPEFVSSEEIERRTTATIDEEYPPEEADLDRRLLSILGAVPADIDLRAVQSELVAGQVEGYYEPETRELVVRSDDPSQPLGPAEQITLAHEVEHAIADQHFGLDLDAEGVPGDAAAASLALIEGDATLTMERFSLEAFDLEQQQELVENPDLAASAEQLESFPHLLTASLLFSYTEGLAFVCDRYAEGGWDAVDAAYQARPRTTAEILFPERYPLEPVEPRPVGAPGGAFAEARSDTLGAADLMFLFEAPGDDEAAALDDPRGRAADWAGGRYTLFTDGPASALGVSLVGGVGGDGPALCDSLAAWYDAAFPDAAEVPAEGAVLARDGTDADGVLACDGEEVRLGIAPDLGTARALVR
jgi:hypothetical protein